MTEILFVFLTACTIVFLKYLYQNIKYTSQLSTSIPRALIEEERNLLFRENEELKNKINYVSKEYYDLKKEKEINFIDNRELERVLKEVKILKEENYNLKKDEYLTLLTNKEILSLSKEHIRQLSKYLIELDGGLEFYKLISAAKNNSNKENEINESKSHFLRLLEIFYKDFFESIGKCFGVNIAWSVLRGAKRDYDIEKYYSFSSFYIEYYQSKGIPFGKKDYIKYCIEESTSLQPFTKIGSYEAILIETEQIELKSTPEQLKKELDLMIEKYKIFLEANRIAPL